jgi:hypothetical protein
MSVIATPHGLVLQLLERAEQLGEGQSFQAWHLSEPRDQVLLAMAEVLRGGLALGFLKRSSCGRAIEEASIFGLTPMGRCRLEELARRCSQPTSSAAVVV